MIDDCTAIILAGGESRRMGRDKAMLPFANQPLIQSVISVVQPLFSETILSVREHRPEILLTQVCDWTTDGGPLMGLLSTFSNITTSWAFVVGCDMPFLSSGLVQQLAVKRCQYQAVIPVVGGKLQPLSAFYERSCVSIMRTSYSLGDKSLLGAIQNLQTCYVDETQMVKADPELHNFFDLDTPQDLAIAQQLDK
jgi:molybdopterin-guanine dinucleotide biosynthesis protein A